MAEPLSTHHLSPNDLLLLQKHVKLGKKHIKNCLSKEEIDTLFQWVKIDREVEKKLIASSMEIASNVSLVYNTILTSILGFWLGLSGFLKWESFSSITLFSVILLSISIGGFIGFKIVLYRRKSARDFLDKIRCKDLEVQIVKKANQSVEGYVKCEKINLINLLKRINVDVGDKELDSSGEELMGLCLLSMSTLKTDGKLLNKIRKKIELKDECNKNNKFKKIAEKLSKYTTSNRIYLRLWIKSNFNRLLIELTPTMLGGAASLFVYIGGTKKLTEEIGIPSWIDFLEKPQTKMIELVFVFLVTSYFVFSFLYQNYKVFKREREVAEEDDQLIQEEKKLYLLNNELMDIKEYIEILQSLEHSK